MTHDGYGELALLGNIQGQELGAGAVLVLHGVILEQDIRGLGSLLGQVESVLRDGGSAVGGTAYILPVRAVFALHTVPGLVVPGDHTLVVVKLTQLHAGGEQTQEGHVHAVLVKDTGGGGNLSLHGGGNHLLVVKALPQSAVAGVALQILARGDGPGDGLQIANLLAVGLDPAVAVAGGGVVRLAGTVAGVGDPHAVAVGGDVAVKSEGLAQQGIHGIGVKAGGDILPVADGQTVIGGHGGAYIGVLDDVAVHHGIVLAQLLLRHLAGTVEPVMLGVVGQVVLDGGDGLLVAVLIQELTVLVLALHTVDELSGHLAGQIGVLAEGLVAAAPAGIAVQVDGGRPEGQLFAVVADHFAGLLADLLGHLIHQVGVPGGAHGEIDGIGRGVVNGGGVAALLLLQAGDAVERLIPPAVPVQTQPGNRRRIAADHLGCLLLEAHLGHHGGGALLEAVVLPVLPNRDGGLRICSGARCLDGRTDQTHAQTQCERGCQEFFSVF